MSDNHWIDLGPASSFPTVGHTCLSSKGIDGTPTRELIVSNVEGEFYALENRCPHAGRPLGDGERAGLTLTCPYHGYTYHIKTGRNIDCPEEETPVKTFPVRVHAGIVQVLLDPEET